MDKLTVRVFWLRGSRQPGIDDAIQLNAALWKRANVTRHWGGWSWEDRNWLEFTADSWPRAKAGFQIANNWLQHNGCRDIQITINDQSVEQFFEGLLVLMRTNLQVAVVRLKSGRRNQPNSKVQKERLAMEQILSNLDQLLGPIE